MNQDDSVAGHTTGKFQFLSLGDLMNHEFPPQKWIVDGLVPAEGMVAVSGNPACNKTWLMMDLALSVASGKPFLDNFDTTQCGVILIDEENPASLLQTRFKRFPLPEGKSPINILPLSGFQLTDENVRFLLREAKRLDAKLIIFDSLVRIHGADENDAKKMAEVFLKMKQLIKAGISVIFIHHNRKQSAFGNSAQAMRGSSDILASVDSHISIKFDEDTGIITLEQTKSRFDKKTDPVEIQIEHSKTATTFQFLGEAKAKKKETKKEKAMELVIEVLQDEKDGANQSKVVDLVQKRNEKMGRNNIIKALEELVESEFLSIRKGEKNATVYFINLDQESEEISLDSSKNTGV